LSHSIQHVHFRSAALGAPLPPEHAAQLQRLTAALAQRLAQDPLDLDDVRWRDRPQRYRTWLEGALDGAVEEDPDVAGGWTVDLTSDASITSPDGDRWIRINGASFELTHAEDDVSGETFLSIIDEGALGSGTRTVQLSATNEASDGAGGVVLFIDSRRARIAAVQVVEPPPEHAVALDPRSTDAWVGVFSPPVSRGARVTVEVEFEGDVPYLRNVLWVADDGADALEPGALFDDTPHALTPAAFASLGSLGRTTAQEFEHRADLIRSSPSDDRRVAQEFFFDLDRGLDPAGPAARLLRQLTSYLGQRVMVRAEEAGFGATPQFDADDVARWRNDVVLTAARIEELALRHFPELMQYETQRFEAAFEGFATGALRVFDTHGTPNGVGYFAFCELAIMMVHYDVQRPFWSPLIPVFARTSELYANAYHRCNGPRTIEAYGVMNNLDGARTQGPAELAANRAAWALVVDPVYSFGRIVHAALHDELVAGPLTPFALEDFGCGGAGPTLADAELAPAPGALDRNWRGGKSSRPKA
jgi:hypothetical protein